MSSPKNLIIRNQSKIGAKLKESLYKNVQKLPKTTVTQSKASLIYLSAS